MGVVVDLVLDFVFAAALRRVGGEQPEIAVFKLAFDVVQHLAVGVPSAVARGLYGVDKGQRSGLYQLAEAAVSVHGAKWGQPVA